MIIVCFNISLGCFAQSSDTIFWNSVRNLKFEDFKSIPDTSLKTIEAVSYLGFKLPYNLKNDTIYLNIQSWFLKSKSWFSKDKELSINDKNLLTHEQGHFGIKELQIRRFKKTIQSIVFNNFKHFSELYNLAIKNLEKEDKIMQKQYDAETNLSKNSPKQKEWNLKIAKELKELENYSSAIIKIPLKKK